MTPALGESNPEARLVVGHFRLNLNGVGLHAVSGGGPGLNHNNSDSSIVLLSNCWAPAKEIAHAPRSTVADTANDDDNDDDADNYASNSTGNCGVRAA